MDTHLIPREVTQRHREEAVIFCKFIFRVYNTAKVSAKFDHTDYLGWLFTPGIALTIADYAASISADALDRAFILHAPSLEKAMSPPAGCVFTSIPFLVTEYNLYTFFWWDLKLWHEETMEAGVKHWGNAYTAVNLIWNTKLPERICARRKCSCCFHCSCDDPLLASNNYQSAKPLPPPDDSIISSCAQSGLRHRIHVH